MPMVELEAQEWQQVMAMISSAPWRDANPLLMKIGAQLQAQHNDMMLRRGPPQDGGDEQEHFPREGNHAQ